MIIKIEISDETLQAIKDGKYVDGSIKVNEPGKKPAPYVFRQFNRKADRYKQDRTILTLEHGWVKESAQRIKLYESVPKTIGVKRMSDVLTRETDDAVTAIANLKI